MNERHAADAPQLFRDALQKIRARPFGLGMSESSVPIPAAQPSQAAARRSQPSPPVIRVLIVDDEPPVLRATARSLVARGYAVVTADNGRDAVTAVAAGGIDVILSDIGMPGMDGIQLLRVIREHDLHVPVVLITGAPAVATAIQALEYGAFHYQTKPVSIDALCQVIEKATRMHRMARYKEQAAELLGVNSALGADRAGLEARFERALSSLWIAYQPIVAWPEQTIFGYEALLRSNEPSLPHPGAVLDAALRLDCLDVLGRMIRNRAAEPIAEKPSNVALFINLHVSDLIDPTLSAPDVPLSRIADRVVLEITERSSLDEVKDVRYRIAQLREMGFRIAVDDLGAGYAGLTSFALLEPEFVKLDMSLVRDVHRTPTKQKLIRSMTALCRDMGIMVVAEGVESADERDVLTELGCDLLQGFLFARPSRAFPEVVW